MGKLDYNKIVNDGIFSKSDASDMVVAINSANYTTYGGNIRRFLKKARDWRAGRYLAKAPTIVILGDSITVGIWSTQFQQYLVDTFNIPKENIIIYAYGGYSPIEFMALTDVELINSNPDLIFYNENEWEGASGRIDDNYIHMIEQVIQRCRKHTTADIMIGTWSMDGDVALDYYNGIDIYDNIQYQFFNWYRDLAATYNCELIDFNQGILDYIDLGNNPTGHYTGVHWDSTWYTEIWNPELAKHFQNANWQASLNIPYPNDNKEEFIFLSEAITWSALKSTLLTASGAWEYLNGLMKGFATDTIIIDAKNIIGFEITHGDNVDAGKNYTIEIDDGTGYVSPSTLRPFGKLMEYCTEIVSTTYPTTDSWRAKRMRKIAEVTTSFGDNKSISKRYTLIVTNVIDDPTRQTVTFDVKDDTNTVIGTTNDPFTDLNVANLRLPSKFNAEWNWAISQADGTFPANSILNFQVGDEFEFYTKSNWIDTVNVQNDKEAFVFGLEPGDYLIKITILTAPVYLLGINLLHS